MRPREPAQLADVWAARRAPPRGPTGAASPSARIAGRATVGELGGVVEEALELARAGAQVHQHRALLDGRLAERGHGRASARARKSGSLLEVRARCRRARSADALDGVARLDHEPADVPAVVGQLARARVSASVTRSRITRSCSARTSQQPRRSGAAPGTPRRIASFRSSGRPGQPGAELVQDQAEALAVGQPHDVLDQVRRDRGGGLRSTGTRPPSAAARVFAVPGRQSRKYSPSGDCGRVSQNTSARSDPKPCSVDLHLDERLLACARRASTSMTRAGVDARHAHVAALDQAERVVELDDVAARVVLARRPAASASGQRARRRPATSDGRRAASSARPGAGSGRS